MRSSFARLTVVRLRYPLVVDHGVRSADYAAEPERLEIRRCWLEPLQSQEDTDGRQAVSSGWTVDAPYDADITAADRVEYDGKLFELDGDLQRVPSPTGALNSSKFVMRRWEG